MRTDARRREQLRPPSWDELLTASTRPWMLHDASQIDLLAGELAAPGR